LCSSPKALLPFLCSFHVRSDLFPQVPVPMVPLSLSEGHSPVIAHVGVCRGLCRPTGSRIRPSATGWIGSGRRRPPLWNRLIGVAYGLSPLEPGISSTLVDEIREGIR
jgi:hypothetical protein